MPGESPAAESVAVQAFGVTVEVTADAQHLSAVRHLLPPSALPAGRPEQHGRFALVPAPDGDLLQVMRDEQPIAGPVDVDVALGILDNQMRVHIALNAPDHVFVHAGTVGVGERAIVLPGRSFAGKTSLVVALIQAGAEYWSDEYAVLDHQGRVLPYPKPLSVRIDDTNTTDRRAVETMGGRAGDRPLAVGLVALTHYRRGGSWTPRTCTVGEGAIKLLEHTATARSQPERALSAVRGAAAGAIILEGERGEADETAAALIAALDSGSGIRER